MVPNPSTSTTASTGGMIVITYSLDSGRIVTYFPGGDRVTSTRATFDPWEERPTAYRDEPTVIEWAPHFDRELVELPPFRVPRSVLLVPRTTRAPRRRPGERKRRGWRACRRRK